MTAAIWRGLLAGPSWPAPSLSGPVTYEIDAPPRPSAGRSLPSWPTGRPLRAWQQAAAAKVFAPRRRVLPRLRDPRRRQDDLRAARRPSDALRGARVARGRGRADDPHLPPVGARRRPLRHLAGAEPAELRRARAARPDGVAVTYATVAAGPEVHRRRCAERPTLLIADEPHHMGEDATWGRTTIYGVRARAVPAAALGHAVSLGQLADPVGALRRGGRLLAPTTTTATRRR